MDIFDTTVLRSASMVELEEITKRRQLAVSAVSLWEVLCHLDEESTKYSREQTFRIHKSNILKARSMKILGVPPAIQLLGPVPPDKFMELEVIKKMFSALETSNSLEEFYSKSVRLSTGETLHFWDCSNGAARHLESLEVRYAANTDGMIKGIKELHPSIWREQINDQEFFWKVAAGCVLEILQQTIGIKAISNDLTILFNARYCEIGYALARAIKYLENPGMKLDGNDTEDYYICHYLDLTQPDILVTNDDGTYKALKRALAAYEAYSQSGVKAACDVMKYPEYQQRFLG